jgi:hypothetical protein
LADGLLKRVPFMMYIETVYDTAYDTAYDASFGNDTQKIKPPEK